LICVYFFFFFFSSRRRHTRSKRDWSSDVCSSDLFIGFLKICFFLHHYPLLFQKNKNHFFLKLFLKQYYLLRYLLLYVYNLLLLGYIFFQWLSTYILDIYNFDFV